MSEEPIPAQTAAPATTATPAKHADAYGQPISAERQAELQGNLDRWQAETDHGDRKGPFDLGRGQDSMQRGVPLTGADISWLAEQSGRDEYDGVSNLHLEGTDLAKAHLVPIRITWRQSKGSA